MDSSKNSRCKHKIPLRSSPNLAQRPDATACAEIELWNKHFGRWVNKGAKGIALLEDSGNRYKLRHVFDISDTHDRYNRPVNIWKMNERNEELVIESLSNTFGELENNKSLSSAIISAVSNSVDDNFSDYFETVVDSKEDSFLEELDELNIEVRLKEILKNSIAYMVLYRSGINPDNMFSFEDFRYITEFNTKKVINILGDASSDISEMVLRVIGDTVKNAQRIE